MWQTTRLTRLLNIDVPIILGPFGGGLSSVQLTALVSNAGGLGSFGANNLNGVDIENIVKQIRQQTQQAFALNIWIPLQESNDPQISDSAFAQHCQFLKPYFDELNLPLPNRPKHFWPDYHEQVAAVLAARPAALSFVFGIPSVSILQQCKDLQILTIGTATTVAEALALDQAGIDVIVASGFEAGGHRTSFLKSAEESLIGTFALVPQVVAAVKAPVVAAGGITNGRGIAAALALGAAGVQIGTAFLACEESGTNHLHRQALWNAKHQTTLTRAFSGRLARGIQNRFISDLKGVENQLPPYPIQNWFTTQLKSAAIAQGRSDLISLWSGQAAPLLKYHHAEALMRSLIAETTQVIENL